MKKTLTTLATLALLAPAAAEAHATAPCGSLALSAMPRHVARGRIVTCPNVRTLPTVAVNGKTLSYSMIELYNHANTVIFYGNGTVVKLDSGRTGRVTVQAATIDRHARIRVVLTPS